MKTCPRCKIPKETSTEFYTRRSGKNTSAYCKKCHIDQSLERQRRLKLEAIAYKGGACVRCGYNKYPGALDFHHLDPTTKDFSISRVKKTSMNKEILDELDKCILVCANCHRETHGGF